MENKYYLAVEVKPKNYFPINLVDLKMADYFTDDLEKLDAFTLRYTKKEIMNAIKEANLLDVRDDHPLVVVYYENKNTRKVEALTKDYNYDMWKLLKDHFYDKVFFNKVVNFLNRKVSDEEWQRIKKSSKLDDFLRAIGSLPYLAQRKLYLYLYE